MPDGSGEASSGQVEVFAASRAAFDSVVDWLEGAEAAGLEHGELEARLEDTGRELLRRMFQDHLEVRAHNEARLDEVVDAAGVAHRAVEGDHIRGLRTVFGHVSVRRLAYRRRGHTNLYPADAALNLPAERHSHGLRHLAAIEAARGSFDDACDALARATGQQVAKRQVEGLAAAAAADFEVFYDHRRPSSSDPDDVLVISADGKGIVMRPDALRPATAKAAADATNKLSARLSKGEKRNRKRMATVGAVYDATPAPRTPDDVMPHPDRDPASLAPAPVATNKWLVASVVDDAATVIARLFDEADRRDPMRTRERVALVDGNNHQITLIETQARARHVETTIVIDVVHVLEYLWAAAWSFYDEGDPAAQRWVRNKAVAVLDGDADKVAASIRRRATRHGLDPPTRRNADRCVAYLRNKRAYLDYPTALAKGWPIATGVIEGACRHLVKDRMDITGARWGLEGAEAILRLRALHANGDFDDYWRFHLTQERARVHDTRYAHGVIPSSGVPTPTLTRAS